MLYRFFVLCCGDHRDLHVLTHSFPTRRSSDLLAQSLPNRPRCGSRIEWQLAQSSAASGAMGSGLGSIDIAPGRQTFGSSSALWRSEEHTSELQSLIRISYAVF